MKRLTTAIMLVFGLFLVLPASADAQSMDLDVDPLVLQGGAVFNQALGDFAATDDPTTEGFAENGFNLGLRAQYFFTPRISLFAELTSDKLGMDDAAVDPEDVGRQLDETDWIINIYGAGVRYHMDMGSFAPYGQLGGGMYEVIGNYGDAISTIGYTSDWAFGWNVGGGVLIPTTRGFSIDVGARYHNASTEFDYGATGLETVNWIEVNAYLTYHIGS